MKTGQGRWAIATILVAYLLFYPAAGAERTSKIDLNKAASSQLDGLPGIGPVIAERITRFRDDNGPFKRIEDLMNVRGIGEKTFLKLADQIVVTREDDSESRIQNPE